MRRLLALFIALNPVTAHASPPVTVAVAFDRSHIRPVLAEGEADRATHRLVTADDPVRIASISKLITALGVLRLVDTGRLSLDRDVSSYLGYRLRNPAFPGSVITLRLLLSHQSSLLDSDDRTSSRSAKHCSNGWLNRRCGIVRTPPDRAGFTIPTSTSR